MRRAVMPLVPVMIVMAALGLLAGVGGAQSDSEFNRASSPGAPAA